MTEITPTFFFEPIKLSKQKSIFDQLVDDQFDKIMQRQLEVQDFKQDKSIIYLKRGDEFNVFVPVSFYDDNDDNFEFSDLHLKEQDKVLDYFLLNSSRKWREMFLNPTGQKLYQQNLIQKHKSSS